MTRPPENPRPTKSSTSASPAGRTIMWFIIALCGAALVASLVYIGPEIISTLSPTPTPACVQPTLTLGTAKYRIQSLARAADGSIAVPADSPDVAYWIDGTQPNYVFALSPAQNNLALKTTLKNGDTATITWDNCNSTKYSLSSLQQNVPNNATLLDQHASEITVFVQPDSSTAGFMIKGELMGETITTFNTPNPAEIQAEVSLLETTT